MPGLLNVEAGVDDEPKEFYDRGHTASVMGSHAFLHWLRKSQLREVEDKVLVAQVFPGSLAIAAIIPLVAAYYNVALAVLTAVVKGPKQGLLPRKVALYRCQQLGGFRLADIMCPFGLSNSGSVSFITTQIRKRSKENKEFFHTLQQVQHNIINHAY